MMFFFVFPVLKCSRQCLLYYTRIVFYFMINHSTMSLWEYYYVNYVLLAVLFTFRYSTHKRLLKTKLLHLWLQIHFHTVIHYSLQLFHDCNIFDPLCNSLIPNIWSRLGLGIWAGFNQEQLLILEKSIKVNCVIIYCFWKRDMN